MVGVATHKFLSIERIVYKKCVAMYCQVGVAPHKFINKNFQRYIFSSNYSKAYSRMVGVSI